MSMMSIQTSEKYLHLCWEVCETIKNILRRLFVSLYFVVCCLFIVKKKKECSMNNAVRTRVTLFLFFIFYFFIFFLFAIFIFFLGFRTFFSWSFKNICMGTSYKTQK